MSSELELPSMEDEELLNPKRSPKIPQSVGELLAVGQAMGGSSMDLGRLFNLNPRTVRAAISRVPDDQLQAIRRVYGMVSWMKGHEILDGLQEELLRRIQAGDLEKRREGKYETSTAQLLTMQAIQIDKKEPLAEDARMAEPKRDMHGAGSAIGALLAAQGEMNDALRLIPEGVKRRVEVTTTAIVEEESTGQPVGDAIILDDPS